MECFANRVTRIAAAVTAALFANPTLSAEPILLQDLAPGKGQVYGASGSSDTHLYVQPYPSNGVFALDGSGQTATKVLEHQLFDRVFGLGAISLFSYDDNRHGHELWRSDGTRKGTYLVKDLFGGPQSSYPRTFVRWHDKVYFSIFRRKNQLNLPNPDDPANYDPPQLWSTDGTNEGTQLVTNLDTLTWFWDGEYSDWGYVSHIKAGQDRLFFVTSAANPVADYEYIKTLWQSDGTPEGTFQMKRPASDDPVLASVLLESLGDITYFADNQRAEPPPSEDHPEWVKGELWRTDGSREGTTLLSNALAYPKMKIFESQAYFVLRDETGLHLARTHADTHSTERVATLRPAAADGEAVSISFAVHTSSLYIRMIGVKDNSQTFNELWRYSGSDQSVTLITDDLIPFDTATVKDGTLFFAGGPENNVEPWRSDGTTVGTALLADLNPTGSSTPYFNPPFAGALWFSAFNGTTQDLYRSDGTAAGTAVAFSGPALSSQPQKFLPLRNGTTLFNLGGEYYYTSRGTPDTTSLLELSLREPRSCGSCFSPSIPLGSGALLLGMRTGTLWHTDGSNRPQGTRVVKEAIWPVYDITRYPITENALTPLGQDTVLFFTFERHPNWDRGHNYDKYLRRLWRTDGTQAGTTLVKSFSGQDIIRSNNMSVRMEGLTAHRKLAFFMANDGEHGSELWRTDGTESGTFMVKDLVAGVADASIRNITSARHHVYFTYTDQSGVHLAKTHGSAEDAVDIAILPNQSGIAHKFVAVNDDIYFALGRDLYRSNGRPGDLRRLGQFAQSSLDRYSNVYPYGATTSDWPAAMTAFGNHLYFVGHKRSSDPLQVWRADSKTGKAQVVTPKFKVHVSRANDVGFFVHGGRLFLSVMDRVGQKGGIFELVERRNSIRWVQHTTMSARELRVAGNKMYFAGLDDQNGEEPRVMSLPKNPGR